MPSPAGLIVRAASCLFALVVLGAASQAEDQRTTAKWYNLDVAGSLTTLVPSGLSQGTTLDLENWANAAERPSRGSLAKIGPALTDLYREHAAFRAAGGPPSREFTTAAPLLKVLDESVVMEAVADGAVESLRRDLAALGLENIDVFGQMVSGKLPIDALDDAAALESLRFAQPVMSTTFVGSVRGQAVRALNVGTGRKRFKVRGRGLTVGVISDSYNCLGGASLDIATKDLPAANRIRILDDSGCPAEDEGRAMMQLITDIAPKAKLSFHAVTGGQANFANAILALAKKANGGARIVVDDITIFGEPMLQNGIIAQAVDKVKRKGVAYFSAAGNNGRSSWESGRRGFVKSGSKGPSGGQLNDFDPKKSSSVPLQSFIVGTGQTIILLNWDQPAASASPEGGPSSKSNLDLYMISVTGETIAVGDSDNIGGDPIEAIVVQNNGSPGRVFLAIELVKGPRPGFMKYVIFGPGSADVSDPPGSFPENFATNSGTLFGHANAAGAIAVGAAPFFKTPAFGTKNPKIEPFSSAGGTPIFFRPNGERLNSKTLRKKPEVVGPDGISTTFFGDRNSRGRAQFGGTHFFGTSAAAPNVAAVATLLLNLDPKLTPSEIKTFLQKNAIQMDDPFTKGKDKGFNFGTGHGLVNATKTLRAVKKAK